jgi:hypothetical protein
VINAGDGAGVGDDLRRGVERRLLCALSRFGPGVERVTVRLSDVANPMGGVDRRCRMRAYLRRQESIRVETMDGPQAIDRAASRLAERVEWALASGRAEDDARLMQEGAPSIAQVRSRPAARRGPRAPRRRRSDR